MKTGSQFASELQKLTNEQREEAITEAIIIGNQAIPDTALRYIDIDVNERLSIKVTADYLCLGTDDDPLYVPLWPVNAQRIADAWDCIMPTTKIVDIIWQHANKVNPAPWGAPYDVSMSSTTRIIAHSERVKRSTSAFRGQLVAGHKKDVVLTNKLLERKDKVAIYGWHQANGEPIQQLHLEHSNHYCDYSHGHRFVSNKCILDGNEESIEDVLKDNDLSYFLSEEGPLKLTRYPYT